MTKTWLFVNWSQVSNFKLLITPSCVAFFPMYESRARTLHSALLAACLTFKNKLIINRVNADENTNNTTRNSECEMKTV